MNTNRGGGFTLVEIMIFVAILGLLLSIAVPNLINCRDSRNAASQKQNQ